jgi:hypothetical protein
MQAASHYRSVSTNFLITERRITVNTKRFLLPLRLTVLASIVTAASDIQANNKFKLEGSWELEITPDPGAGLPPSFKALATFSEGGGVIETILLPAVTPAHGEWAKIGNRDYTFAIVHHLFDPAGNFVGTVRAKSLVRLTNPSEFTATFQGTLFDPNGHPIVPVSGTETGRRIKAE